MFRMSEDTNSITFKFSSEMYLVDRVIQTCREYLGRFNVSEFSQFRLVVREILINAVEHGNRNVAEHKVTCEIARLNGRQFSVMVEDEGDGFEYKTLNMEMPEDPHELRSRGYALINAFTDQIEFNDKGNRVTVYFSPPQVTKFSVGNDDGWQIVTPSGDITASTADKFRTILVELLDQGHRQYRFDFSHVEDIDSVALSVMIIFAKMLGKERAKSQLEIVNARKALADLFQMTRMDKTYSVKS